MGQKSSVICKFMLLRTKYAYVSSFLKSIVYAYTSFNSGSVTLLEYKVGVVKMSLEGN